MKRRTVLTSFGALLLAGGAVYGGSLGACALAAPAATARLGDPRRLFAALGDLPDPTAVGHVMLSEASLFRFGGARELRRLARDTRVVQACAIACPGARSAAFRDVIAKDFNDGNTMIAERWVVSNTEARIAALWVLDNTPPLAV